MTIRTSTLKARALPVEPAPTASAARPPVSVAAIQASVALSRDGGDAYRQLGLVTAMALEQRVAVGDVLLAMRTIVETWGHLASPDVSDLP